MNDTMEKMESMAQACYETIISRIKQYRILCDVFHNSMEKHGHAFYAMVNITQIRIEMGKTPCLLY
jgi:hypothetical protein